MVMIARSETRGSIAEKRDCTYAESTKAKDRPQIQETLVNALQLGPTRSMHSSTYSSLAVYAPLRLGAIPM